MPEENAMILSGRVRLARNYQDLPFSRQENAAECLKRACNALHTRTTQQFTLHVLANMKKNAQLQLMEKHLISADLLNNAAAGAALIRSDKLVSVMVNEEDHLRIQAIENSGDLEKAAENAFDTERILAEESPFSFDPKFGYLTTCPTNTGTGMRASLMLHLPLLTRCKQMGLVGQNIAKLGLTIRGIYGEGSEALGDLYQISNQVSLGRTEEDIIKSVQAVGKQLIALEDDLRKKISQRQNTEVTDVIMRSYGLMRYAYSMDQKEFMRHWSNVRLGITLSLIDLPLSVSTRLLTTAQDAHIRQYAAKKEISSVRVARCAWIKECLETVSKKEQEQ